MHVLPNILFVVLLGGAAFWFSKNVGRIRRNILLGRDIDRSDKASKRRANMFRVAFGQSKMQARPIAGILHFIIYVSFLIINIEVLEIVIDGIFGTHRFFASFLGRAYDTLISFFEILAVATIITAIIFWWRRNIGKLDRFHKPEMKGWPFKDANIILYIEVGLMIALLNMNAVEENFSSNEHSFLVSHLIAPIWSGLSVQSLHIVERLFWWIHITGILAFLNYLPFSKHFHIILAFPNTYYANLEAKGKFTNNATVTKEVKLMMDPSADPFAAPAPETETAPEKFGAKDANDLSWINLLNAYTCTECGRCTSECPANLTGKKLSPRKIMMDTRDRIDEIGKNIEHNGQFIEDNKSLLGDYISKEELWACTSCNACVQACPVDIDPLNIIMQLRNFATMEESSAPAELNAMMTNVENNGAPWPFSQMDRANWINE
ncbi:(Fe-S)-binding protein [Schleiferiaceae bacterium]|nr:Fe-S oxidoreductase [Flavobacteriales bacterium]MDC1022509.1 (Fe-S)-binding protein [Schleiferiaceae bacterium]|tara:strand:- start:1382 stop:2686 length:1305 start_codon:yes stop_codon:yes gene_type:complete